LERTEEQLVVFDLAAEAFSVDIGSVREIIRMQDITRVPGAPGFVEGIINLRGNVIPVIDLRKRFDISVNELHKDNRIVVMDISGQDMGVVVDAVTEVLRISAASVEPPSSVITTADSVYLLGIVKMENRMVILLDLDKVLSDREKGALTDVAAMADAAD
jgi:purine-binding chemotaxis protein CheW|tara:strand:+ start:3607 stop:4086 length:480 start_codon:yes stop_codon:yes gene_type:complete